MQTLQLSEDKREAYTGLQAKMAEQRGKMNILGAQLGMASREEKRNKLTLTELDALPSDTTTYKAVGRMFIQEPCEKIIEELVTTTKQAASDIEKFSEQRVQLESSMKETEKAIKEILSTAVVVKPGEEDEKDE